MVQRYYVDFILSHETSLSIDLPYYYLEERNVRHSSLRPRIHITPPKANYSLLVEAFEHYSRYIKHLGDFISANYRDYVGKGLRRI